LLKIAAFLAVRGGKPPKVKETEDFLRIPWVIGIECGGQGREYALFFPCGWPAAADFPS
jgi:hypothetical protein